MNFRDDCRFLGGITAGDGETVQRICGLTSSQITTCDGCQAFESNHQPCAECGLFQLCQKKKTSSETTKTSTANTH